MKKSNFWIWSLVIVFCLGFGIWGLGFWLGGCASTVQEEMAATTTTTGTTTTTETGTSTTTTTTTTTSTTTTTFFTVWTGTKQFGTPKLDRANGITVDNGGNVYVAGTTAGSLEGNPNAGGRDFFVVKYDSAGNRKWIWQRGTSNFEEANGVAVDSSGNVYVAGILYGQSADGTVRTDGYALLDKYDTNGNWQWEIDDITLGGSYECNEIKGIAVDTSDNIYITGRISVIHVINGQPSYGDHDIFVAKYNAGGNKQWIQKLGSLSISGGYNDDWGNAIAADIQGNVYITGNIGGNTLEGDVAGSGRDFVVKYNSLGSRESAVQFASVAGIDMAQGIAVDSGGNIYVAGGAGGFFQGNTGQGEFGYFLAKFNPSGSIEAIKQSGSGQANGVAVDTGGEIYSAGFINLHYYEPAGREVSDIFLNKYNASCIEQWIKQKGTLSDVDVATGVAVDANGNIFITGFTSGSLGGNVNQGDYDAFVIKYDSSGVKQ